MNRIALCVLFSCMGFCPGASGQGGMESGDYARLPLSFEANTGQADKSVTEKGVRRLFPR